MRIALVASTSLLAFTFGAVAHAQLVAFPGAEGAGQYAVGGRNGDVYYVTNLNDSGTGSLRTGISTAPATGRTILFKVSGTIQLLTDLKINKPNLTVAGQSAPGGGITLSGHELHVQDTHDVIVQHLRIRVGDLYTQPTNPTGYGPDSFGIENVNNVMIDHVSASWSIDENLSVTHDSNNVTVQWSTIAEALKNAGHPKGAHSYGSLINGTNVTYAHNLYESNDSRNPRPEGAGDTSIRPGTLNLDFVNNVIENPGGRFGYSGDNISSNDDYRMNYVGNYGISGPSTSATALFNPASAATQIYVPAGTNYLDRDKNGILNGTAATGTRLMNGAFTNSPTRFDLPEVTTLDATQAYIQVLSRAGANYYRDPVDRRLIRNVMNQKGAIIDSQNQVGGYPALPSGQAPADSNNDGVPDYFAVANGFNTTTDIHKLDSGNGYTWLESYLHSLNSNGYAPANTVSHTISTAFGRGADAFVSENGGAVATSAGNGSGATLDAAWGGSGGTTNQVIELKFDLSQIVPGTVTSARLELSAASAISGTHNFTVYGLEHDAAGWNWSEDSVEFADAPGLAFDQNSHTLGIDDQFDDTSTSTYGDPANLLRLGELNLSGTTAVGTTLSVDNPNLAVFLNLAAYFSETPEAGVVTLLLQQNNNGSTASFYSKEGDALLAPRLVVDALPNEVIAPTLAGDYNDDGMVDAADYTVWRDALATGGSLLNETESLGTVDAADYQAWRTNFGAVRESGAASLASVPEPASAVLVSLAAILGALAPQRRQRHRA
jgi:pectate lyase